MSAEIESILHENRVFKPSKEFSRTARVRSMRAYRDMMKKAEADYPGFWGDLARTHLEWEKPFSRVLNDSNPPFFKWFEDGLINVSVNCLDRHLTTPRKNKAAIVWEGEPGDVRTLTYQELAYEVGRFSNVLKESGVVKGDRVIVYMPMVPELPVALLACARIGATHSVVFGGFSAEALKDRILDAGAKILITADGGWRRGQTVPLKEMADEALKGCPQVSHVVVLKRTGQAVAMQTGRDVWWHDAVQGKSPKCAPVPVEPEHPLFILYTSGSTGKPKGVVHSSGGYLLGATMTMQWVFDIQDHDTFWCTADIGWVTGHSYVVYGPLSNGATSVMYEGAPTTPHAGRLWEIVEKHSVNIFYTAPTAIRALVKLGDEWPQKFDLSSLRILGTVGEPINPEAWMWYYKTIGGERCPIVDTWWQTETGMHMISPLPGATPIKPGSATLAVPGIFADVVDAEGNSLGPDKGGYLVVKRPWPSMIRTVHGDPERYKKTYWGEFGGRYYFAGDGARKDKDGYFWIMGRVDDVINVAGHRLGTMEVESALVSHPAVAEAAVVGCPDDLKGEGIFAFVILKGGEKSGNAALVATLRDHVAKEIGPIAKPDHIKFTDGLPKTRSGKIMRRLLRDIAAGRETKGDISTLEDSKTLESLRHEE
ncbi:MAG: acetate--CoA ligase [Nitrospirota bacterium]|nr:acetate--CoA ligase [Nitrospirota bacterium]